MMYYGQLPSPNQELLLIPYIKKAEILYFLDAQKVEILKLVYSFVNKDLPQPLMNMFFNQNIHKHNTRQSNDPHHDPCKYGIVFDSFFA